MSSGCCSGLACPCQQVTRFGDFGEETSDDDDVERDPVASAPSDMDIALLKEQYNSIKDKQKRETRVICFNKAASNNKEISGKSLVNVVPMRQVRHSLIRQASFVKETKFDFVRDLDSAPWRTHLGMYRRTCAAVNPSQHHHNLNTSTVDSSSSPSVGDGDRSAGTTDLSNHLSEDSDGVNENHHDIHEDASDFGLESSRKFSAPAVFARQLSSGSTRSTHSSASLHHYPFPQLKCPRKSEAARRLGLYSSF